jgi:Ca-activated chloride channel homolog
MRTLVVAGALALLSAMPAARQARFTAKVESVRVDVLATAGNNPVTDLTAADFEIKDNGVVQKVSLVGSDKVPVNVMLALDTSASLSHDRLTRLRAACAALIDKLLPGESAGLITFSHVVTQRQALTADLRRVSDALSLVEPSGNTSLSDAVSLGLSVADQTDDRALLVVFSDGVDTNSWQPEDVILASARRSETVVYGVAVTPEGGSPHFLRDVAEETGGKMLEVRSNDRLEAAFVQILEEFRQRYLLSYSPAGATKPGWHKIEVRVKRRGVTVKARPGYFAR